MLLLVSGYARAQYFFTDNFASYNSGALNNGGNYARHEIRATFANFAANGQYNSVDMYLAASAGLTSGYRLAFRTYNGADVSLDVYDLTNSWFSLGGASFTVNPPTVVRAIKAPTGIRIVIGDQSAWIPVSGLGGSMGAGFTGGGSGPITLAESWRQGTSPRRGQWGRWRHGPRQIKWTCNGRRRRTTGADQACSATTSTGTACTSARRAA